MTARYQAVGKPAHRQEIDALKFLIRGLPESHMLYANSWLAERDGALYELDAVVVAPHAVFIVEIKGYTGAIRGTDHDWYTPSPMRSPLRNNRLTAQMLKSSLERENAALRGLWVEGYVFLSHTDDVAISGIGSEQRVHTRESILRALTDPQFLTEHITRGRPPAPVGQEAADAVHRILTGGDRRQPPPRRVREYELGDIVERGEDYLEYAATHTGTGMDHVLRVYQVPMGATQTQREQIIRRCNHEAGILINLGQVPGVIKAYPSFVEDIGTCIPMEYFAGISLPSWVERYLGDGAVERPPLKDRLRTWLRLAAAIDGAHHKGVVHRLLRPEVILLQDQAQRPDLRVGGFDRAKLEQQLNLTVAPSRMDDERAVWAAPEVRRDFGVAQPAADQFSLGAILGLLAAGKPLFSSTKAFEQRGGVPPSLLDLDPRLNKSLDQVVQRMLAVRPEDRYPSLREARQAVEQLLKPRAEPPKAGQDGRPRSKDVGPLDAEPLDPENMPELAMLGSDYQVLGLLGAGGMATVYLVRHLPSGQERVLKVARPTADAEAALRAEHAVLVGLSHPRIVRALDLSKAVPERLALVLERSQGQTLGAWLAEHPQPDVALLQRMAEDLLDALDYLERRGVVHKDIKPDNLLLGAGGLTVIDFSLAERDAADIYIGTALYRDPALTRWTAAADRYAAALCLFELFVGTHAFDGAVPEPEQALGLDEDEVDPPALAPFFRQALSPQPQERFASLDAMRRAFGAALGRRVEPLKPALEPYAGLVADAEAPLTERFISASAAAALRRAGIARQGQLVAAGPERLRRVPSLGRRRLDEVLALRAVLIERGVPATAAQPLATEPPLAPALVDDPRPASILGLSGLLTGRLLEQGLGTVGALAAATAIDILLVPGLGAAKLQSLRRGLAKLQAPAGAAEAPAVGTLEAAWAAASQGLDPALRGVLADRWAEAAGAGRRDAGGSALPAEAAEAAAQLDRAPLRPAADGVDQALVAADGLLPLASAAEAVAGALSTEDDGLATGIAALLPALFADRFRLLTPTNGPALLGWPTYDTAALTAFMAEARHLAHWPPAAADAARRSLAPMLPAFGGDPLDLALRLDDGLALSTAGELFTPPVDPRLALPLLLGRERLPLDPAELRAEADRRYGGHLAWPANVSTEALVLGLGLPHVGLENDLLVAVDASVVMRPSPLPDPLPTFLAADGAEQGTAFPALTSPGDRAAAWLRSSRGTSSWRLVVTPPERHAELGRQVAAALGEDARYVSFEAAFLERIEDRFADFETAERMSALRGRLKKEAEGVLEALLAEHGRPGTATVLGDTALLGLCEAKHLVTRVYERALGGALGFWVLVVPGVVHQQQPLLNEVDNLGSWPGMVLPLAEDVGVAA